MFSLNKVLGLDASALIYFPLGKIEKEIIETGSNLRTIHNNFEWQVLFIEDTFCLLPLPDYRK